MRLRIVAIVAAIATAGPVWAQSAPSDAPSAVSPAGHVGNGHRQPRQAEIEQLRKNGSGGTGAERENSRADRDVDALYRKLMEASRPRG